MTYPWKVSKALMAVALLSFSSGLPLLLVGSTLQAWYTVAGVGLHTIGLLSLIGMPYLYKFLWAPLLDRCYPASVDRRFFWVRLMQLGIALGFTIMAFLDPSQHASVLAVVAFVVACFSATQDTAIDAYRADIMAPNQRASASAMTNIAYRAAMILAGAIAMILAATWGWRWMYGFMALLMVFLVVLSFSSPKSPSIEKEYKPVFQSMLQPLSSFWKAHGSRLAITWLVFMVIYKFAESLTLSLNTTFLLRHCGFTLLEVGSISKFVGIGATLLGSVVAGVIQPRLGLYRSLFLFGFMQTAASLGFMLLAVVKHHYSVMVGVLFFDYFFGGLSSVAFVVMLMGLCQKHFSATQYALFSALSAVTRVLVGPFAAWSVMRIGWFGFYGLCFVLGAPALMVLAYLKKPIQGLEQSTPLLCKEKP